MRLCENDGCSTIASYGMKGSARPEFCSQHKGEGMVDVCTKRCAYQGCSKFPSFGTDGSRKREFCSEHKKAGMVNVGSRRCAYQGCSKIPSYGTDDGSRKREFCSEHKRAGMVDLVSQRCAYQGCSKFPSFGTDGSRTPKVCSEHKQAGMVHVGSRRCAYQGCSKIPTYGTDDGSRKREFCGKHKRTGMVNVKVKRCAHDGCSKVSSYGTEDSRKPEFCCEHKMAGMVNVTTKRCAYERCLKQRFYGKESSKKAVFCGTHKTTAMVNVSKKRCTSEGCTKCPVYGLGGSPGRRCLSIGNFKKRLEVEARYPEPGAQTMRGKYFGPVASPNKGQGGVKLKGFPGKVRKTPGTLDCGPIVGKRKRIDAEEKTDRSQEAQQSSVQVSPIFRESPPPLSATGFTPPASQRCNNTSPESQKLSRDERARSWARRRLAVSAREMVGEGDIAPTPSVTQAKPAQREPTLGVVHTNTDDRERIGSTATTTLRNGALAYVDCDERVEVGDVDVSSSTVGAGAGKDVSSSSGQDYCYTRASCSFFLQDRQRIASLEKETREAMAEAKKLRNRVEQLERQEADAIACRAHAVAQATREVERKNRDVVQALRDELSAASTKLNQSKGAVEAMSEERKELRQQVAFADKKNKAQAANADKTKYDFQHQIEALRAELTEATTGWKTSKDALKSMCQERDALHKQVASAANTIRTEALRADKAKEDFQKEIQAMREELAAAASGWENTKDALDIKRHDRDALHKELQEVKALQAEIAGSVAATFKLLGHRVENAIGGTGGAVQARVLAAESARSSSGGATSVLQTSAEAAAPNHVVNGVVVERGVGDNMALCKLKAEAAGVGVVSPVECLPLSTVTMKHEI